LKIDVTLKTKEMVYDSKAFMFKESMWEWRVDA